VGGDVGYEKWQIGEKWKSRICPRKLLTADSARWINLFSSYRAGFLLKRGGLEDQPAVYVSTMQAIHSFATEATWPEKPSSK
jgi:hypothetical protein